MLRRLILGGLFCAALLPLVGCVDQRTQIVESATALSEGRLWLLGSEGLASRREASGERVAGSYPRTRVPSAYAHHPRVAPTATVLEVAGATLLVTRSGERYSWRESAWVPLPDVIRPLTVTTPVQVDAALVDGDLLFLQLHDGRLLWLAPETGVVREERVSRHVERLTVLSGLLVGVAFDGNRRLLVRRLGPDRWEQLASLPDEPDGSRLEVLALGRAGDHYIVVSEQGVSIVAANGAVSRRDLGLGMHSRIRFARVDEQHGVLMHVSGTRSGFFQVAMASLGHADGVKAAPLARCAALEYGPSVVAIVDQGGLVAVGADGSIHRVGDRHCSQIGEPLR